MARMGREKNLRNNMLWEKEEDKMYFPLASFFFTITKKKKKESLALKVLSLKILETHKFFLQWILWKTVLSRITD